MRSPPRRRRSSVAARMLMRALLVAVLPLAAACKDSPTPPKIDPFTPAELGIFMPALQDARERIVPALENKAIAASVGGHLKELSDNLGTRHIERSRNAVNQAVVVLNQYMKSAQASTADIPEVGAIQLVLYHAGLLLRMQIDPALLPYVGVASDPAEQ